ncbi:MAG TPA: carboxypeptidase regulatory-like domain-containing protein [Gemmatimonadales bacterium]|nr:carboxypeptidase regulatory-like domain-containing protein [Gemmatimonadales bacterium]
MHALLQLLLLIPLVTPDTSANQAARLTGYALSAYNGRPLQGVVVSVSDADKSVVTDAQGAFAINDLPAGPQKIHLSYNGRKTADYTFALREGKVVELAIVLDVAARDLAPIVVERRMVDTWRDLAGFYERRRQYTGYGRFFTREDIDHQRPARLSALLRGAGISQWCARGYECMTMSFNRGHLCAIPVSVNGLPIWERDFDRIPMDHVAAVEIYRDPNPEGFGSPRIQTYGYDPDPIYGTEHCGSVGIWTR